MLQKIVDGRTDLVFDFLAAGHLATASDDAGVPLIRWCAYYGDVTAIRFLLTHGASLQTLGDNLGLPEAAFHGHWRLCQFLIEHGANVNDASAVTGETPLHLATCKPNRPAYDLVVEVLLAHGATPNRTAHNGATSGAFMRDARTRGETPLHRAAAFCSATTIQKLLTAGATVDARDAFGDSPLSWASWHLRPDPILRLLVHGPFSIHPQRASTFDHGSGWGEMECSQLGVPHLPVTPPAR